MPQSFRPPNTRSRKYNEPIRLSLSVRPSVRERKNGTAPAPGPPSREPACPLDVSKVAVAVALASRVPEWVVVPAIYPLHDAIDADAVRCTQPWERRLARPVAVRDKCRPARAPLARYRSLWLFAGVQLRHTRYSRRVYSHSPQCTTPTPTIYYCY
jgi:hypothetical protein